MNNCKQLQVFSLMACLCFMCYASYSQEVELNRRAFDASTTVFQNVERNLAAEQAEWDVLASFNLTSGGQQGVVSDGINIYTCSWQANPSGGYSFYKYDMQGSFIEGFNISGVGEIRDLTYDGQYFYGSDGTNYLFTIDLVNKSLVGSVSTTCTNIQHCSYDPDNDGFWVGYWYTLRLINRSGQTIRTAPAPNGAHSSGYYVDSNGVKHLYLFCEPDDNALVYDYNITTNVMGTSPIFDYSTVPGYSNAGNGGLAGGCFVGPYEGKTAFYGNVQQSPNFVAILELDEEQPSTDPVTVILSAGDVWGDGTGYQMLLDADANTYGSVIPTSGGLTSSGDAAPEVYAQFEYKIPENADGAMNTQNIVFNSSIAIEIPAGVYDWCITNPTPNDRIWIASNNGNVGGRQNDYHFESNKTYEFVVTLQDTHDAVNVTITDGLSYMINTSVDPQNSGLVSGGGIYREGSTCTLVATASSGYSFEKWTKNGVDVSSNPAYSFTVEENATYTAHFTSESVTCLITTASDPLEGGTTSGGGTYPTNAWCTISAVPNPGYVFEKWTKGQGVVDTLPTHTFVVTTNANYVAHFVQAPSETFIITALSDPAEGGTVTGDGSYNQGETCTLTAYPNFGYEFVKWTKNGMDISVNPTFNFTVTENAVYVAHFTQGVSGYTISASVNPINGGIVTGAGTYAQGVTCTLTATPSEGYKFVNWTESGVIQCLTDQYVFVVSRDRSLVANFEELPSFTISAMASANGSISPQGDVQVYQGSEMTFTIIPNFGARIASVVVDEINIGVVESYTFTNVNRDHTIFASFSGLGVDESLDNNLSLYPNPANDEVTIEGDGISAVRVYDMHGKILYDTENTSDQITISMSGFLSGTYVVEVNFVDGRKGHKILNVIH